MGAPNYNPLIRGTLLMRSLELAKFAEFAEA